jgi:phosphate transport system permease protein
MSIFLIILALLAASLAGLVAGMSRARRMRLEGAALHSRPPYHGFYVALATGLAPLVLIFVWSLVAPGVITNQVLSGLSAKVQSLSSAEQSLVLGQIEASARGIARLSTAERQSIEAVRDGAGDPKTVLALLQSKGVAFAAAPTPATLGAALEKAEWQEKSSNLLGLVALLLAAAGFALAYSRLKPELRARNRVETVVKALLIAASSVAVLTTFGIFMSVLFETMHFFHFVNPMEFFFGTVWDPRFAAAGDSASASGGQFGLLPLLWGTMFISLVALLVAVPIGLMSAIYMAEYASSSMRNAAKPMLEILAGIPTIVYGFFALTTLGPMLRDFGAMIGVEIAASSVLSAGIVMGVMIIPYVSSLSDDIITAVPRALRDGAYALGATKSETIRGVVMPAALPGIVGAILLAASRAIGETMIVVLAAGIAAKLTVNPFQAVTTMTVKIVSQLTGDLEFTSPQTLVAFALGLTLFVITLILNIYALYIVRKYREQYE